LNDAHIKLAYRLPRPGFSLDVELSLPARGITGILGPSGSGKTTLLRCMAGLERGADGRLEVGGETWEDTAASLSLPVHRRRVGYVFQEPRLFRHLDVRRNLDYALRRRDAGTDEVEEARIVDMLGIAHLLSRRVGDLSGGEAQRVAIARALLRAPRLVLMDEPLASLDRRRRDDVMPFLDRMHADLELPIIYVSHSIDEICRLCDHLVVLDDGRVVSSGELQAVLTDPGVGSLQGEDAGVVVETRVLSYSAEDELTELAFAGGELRVAGRHGNAGERLRLRVRASDISLCRERPAATSILNIVPVEVEALDAGSGGTVLVRVAVAGDRLLARVTRRSVRELAIAPGDRLYAQIKSVSIRNVPLVGQS